MTEGRPQILVNKPLVEAIVEIKWGQEGQVDPAYPIVVGRLYERVAQHYPAIEDLPIIQVPAELTVHLVRHRFRRVKDGWPLIQVGPGILTVNETKEYHWDDFSSRVKAVVPKLYDAHPSPTTLNINRLLLRYINAIKFDYLSENLLTFLSTKLQLSISLPLSIFREANVDSRPQSLGAQLVFPVQTPAGSLMLKIGTGKQEGQNALVWEMLFLSDGAEVLRMPEGFPAWLDAAHAVIEKWFFAMVKGELLDSFMRAS